MVNRLALTDAVLKATGSLKESDRAAYQKLMDAVLAFVILQLDLESARKLPAAEREELAHALNDILSLDQIKKVSLKWEKLRKPLWAGLSATDIAGDLADLLERRREPYEGLSGVSLRDARSLDGRELNRFVERVQRIAPPSDLTKLMKAWDKHAPPLSGRKEIAAHLLRLRSGAAEPTPAPPKPPKTNVRRSV